MNQPDNKTYTVMPGMNMGVMELGDLEKIVSVCRRFDVPAAKITNAQRLAFLGTPPGLLAELKKELRIPDQPPHHRRRVHYVQACPGSRWCKYGTGDSLKVGKAIENLVLAGPLPGKIKVGVSGCPICCCESWVRDVGLIAQKKGWRFIFGGNAAGKPRIGDVVAENLNNEEAVALVEKCLNFYGENAKVRTRSARFMEHFGIEQLKKSLFGA
ncbi:MAG: nitrite reductase [Desulfobulbaceae bacterium]|nr:nitrite reductase [Desulfobulbaceae bacterium]